MRNVAIALLALGVSWITVASPRAEEVGRYTMRPTDDGFLRLDTKSGAISLCRKTAESWACGSVADDRLALMREIDRLTRENRRLTKNLQNLNGHRQVPPNETDRPAASRPKLDFPSKEEVDEAMDFVEGLLQRFKDMVENLQKQPDDGTQRRL